VALGRGFRRSSRKDLSAMIACAVEAGQLRAEVTACSSQPVLPLGGSAAMLELAEQRWHRAAAIA